MKIAILGTRGIPNHYGGFEQFAAYLSVGLVNRGHEVVVYNSHLHPYQESSWKGVKIIHCKDLEDKIGTAGQFIYDFNCILNARKQQFDVILQLGYTSSSIWGKFLPKKPVIITNMDGLEWKRTKFSRGVRQFLRYAEKLAVKTSDHLIADSLGIQQYLKDRHAVDSTYIAYGATPFTSPNEEAIEPYALSPNTYFLLVARMEPENNIETILDGYKKSNSEKPFVVVGSTKNTFGSYLKDKFGDNKNILFLDAIYDIEILDNLRHHATLYFHGHSVGGTNPSLLEAMASGALIVAYDNVFNRSVLGKEAFYFSNEEDVVRIISDEKEQYRTTYINANLEKVKTLYSWDKIIDDYERLFIKLAERSVANNI